MGEYTVFSEISQELLRRLRERMCPSPVASPAHIEVNSPSREGADYLLGLYLYDVREEGKTAGVPYPDTGQTRMLRAPEPYALYYMLYVNGASQIGLKELDFQKIIGRAAQVLNDISELWPGKDKSGEPPAYLTSVDLSLEDKTKIWQAIGKPFQISLFFKVATVFLSGVSFVEIPRVSQTDISLFIPEGGERHV